MPNPLFSTKVVRSDGATIVYVQGEIDIATAGRLRDAIEPHLGPQQTIILDLSDVDFMDSSCIEVLVQARGALTADGGSLVLRNPSALARRILSLSGVECILAGGDEHQRPLPEPVLHREATRQRLGGTNARSENRAP